MPSVYLTRRARKTIAKLPLEARRRCAQALRVLAGDPLRGEALLGEFRGLRRYRVGELRIVYRFETRPKRILVIAIGHRREIYR